MEVFKPCLVLPPPLAAAGTDTRSAEIATESTTHSNGAKSQCPIKQQQHTHTHKKKHIHTQKQNTNKKNLYNIEMNCWLCMHTSPMNNNLR